MRCYLLFCPHTFCMNCVMIKLLTTNYKNCHPHGYQPADHTNASWHLWGRTLTQVTESRLHFSFFQAMSLALL